MNDFIKKEVVKERTGAGVSPITVDTQSRFLINSSGVPNIQLGATPNIPMHKNMFLETLGDIVKDAEKARINNNKFELDLQLKKMDLEFKEKWSKDNNKYTDNYEAYLQDFEKLHKEKQKIIMDNRFLGADEKRHITEKLKLNKMEDRIGIQETRDKIYIHDQVEKSQALVQQAIDISSQYGINEDNKAKELYSQIANVRNEQKKMTGMTDDKYLVLLGGDIANAETNRLSTEITKIMNSDSSIQYKEQELKKLQSYFENDNAYNILAHEIVDNYYKGDDKERAYDYLKVKVQGNIKSIMKQTRSSFNAIKRQEKALEKLAKKEREQEEIQNNRQIENALFERNGLELASLYDKRKGDKRLTMTEFLSNPKYLESVTDKNWDTFGDMNNGETIKILSNSAIRGIDEARENARINGASFEQEFGKLYEMADAISNGNNAVRINIIKNYGLEKGINPTVLLKGENDENYFKMANSIKQATSYINEFGIEEEEMKKLKKDKNFKALSKKFSDNEIIGNDMATKYLISEALKGNNTKDLIKDFKFIMPRTAKQLNNYNKTDVDRLDREVKVLKEITTNRIDYRYTSLKNINEKKEIKKYESKFLTEQSDVFGG